MFLLILENVSEKRETIRIYHEVEGRIEKFVPRITIGPGDWRHEACRVMKRDEFFLSHPHTNNEFFFLLTTVFIYLFLK